jgi:hypothetical protein
MRQLKEVSPLFKIGRGDSPIYDELDEYDDNWDLRDVPLSLERGSHSEAAETELTQRRRGSLHHDEEEAVLCPLVFMVDDDDESLESQQSSDYRRAGTTTVARPAWWPVRRRGRPKKSAIGIGVIVFVAAALAFLAWLPTISEHAVSFKSSLNTNRQLRSGAAAYDENIRVTFPASVFQISKAASSALEALF